MWKKLYSNSGLILIAILAAGVWYSNLKHLFPDKNEPCVDAVAAPSPSPTLSFEELLEQERTRPSPPSVLQLLEEERLKDQPSPPDDLQRSAVFATAICADGTYSYSARRRGACSRHGGVARWLIH